MHAVDDVLDGLLLVFELFNGGVGGVAGRVQVQIASVAAHLSDAGEQVSAEVGLRRPLLLHTFAKPTEAQFISILSILIQSALIRLVRITFTPIRTHILPHHTHQNQLLMKRILLVLIPPILIRLIRTIFTSILIPSILIRMIFVPIRIHIHLHQNNLNPVDPNPIYPNQNPYPSLLK